MAMKQNRKEQETLRKSRNQGFSLVELIVVIAIMAVLVAVLAPQFTKYVDRSRQSVDATTVGGIVTAAQVGVADVTDYSIKEGTYVITLGSTGTTVAGGTGTGVTTPDATSLSDMKKAIEEACGTLTNLKSTANKWESTGIIVNIVVSNNGSVTVDYSGTPDFEKYIGGNGTGANSTENGGGV